MRKGLGGHLEVMIDIMQATTGEAKLMTRTEMKQAVGLEMVMAATGPDMMVSTGQVITRVRSSNQRGI